VELFLSSFKNAIELIISGDPATYQAIALSIKVGFVATTIAAIIGLPIALMLSTKRFRGRALLVTIFNASMGLPSVVVGLVGYGLLSHKGILGMFNLLFTPYAIIMGDVMLGIPTVVAIAESSLSDYYKKVEETIKTLSLSRLDGNILLIKESIYGIMGAVSACFGRIFEEVGAAMMLGGNIMGITRTMTTAIALETTKGEFARGVALGMILLSISISVNIALQWFKKR